MEPSVRIRRSARAYAQALSDMSSERIWCVSAPTEMKSTPHSAYSRIVSRVMPPLDSASQRPAPFPTPRRVIPGGQLSTLIASTPPAPETEEPQKENEDE